MPYRLFLSLTLRILLTYTNSELPILGIIIVVSNRTRLPFLKRTLIPFAKVYTRTNNYVSSSYTSSSLLKVKIQV